MKVLDVVLFQDGLHRQIAKLDKLREEADSIYQVMSELVKMEEQLKGSGGNAIRSFYKECHLPFLQFFKMFTEKYKLVLQQTEAALHSLEPESAGYIAEQFLEGELEHGITLIGQLVTTLTDDTNSIMDQVSDIVSLPHLDDSEVQEGVIHCKRKRDDTVIALHEFDITQTTALQSIEQDLQTMNAWLMDLEGLFKAGVKDVTFEQNQWNVLTLRSEIRTELFPKAYSNPNGLWVEEQKQLIGTMVTSATFQTLEGKKVNTVKEDEEDDVIYHVYENGLVIKEYIVNKTVFYKVVSKDNFKQEHIEVEKPKENKPLDFIQTGLDVVGLIPVVGEVADGINGVIYSARGDVVNAGLSFSAMIPVVGWASTGGKFIKNGNDLFQARNVINTEAMKSVYSPIYQDVINVQLGITQNRLNLLSSTRYQIGTPNLHTLNTPQKTYMPESIKSGNVNTSIHNADAEIKNSGNTITKSEYKNLRKKTPSNEIRKMVNPDGPKVDPVYGYEVDKFEADHIVSMKEITKMDGFSRLSREQQIEILNLKDNFVGLGKSSNASKGAHSWADWKGHSKIGEVPVNVRKEMLEKEDLARRALKLAIEERLK